jgi:hypothetical protein
MPTGITEPLWVDARLTALSAARLTDHVAWMIAEAALAEKTDLNKAVGALFAIFPALRPPAKVRQNFTAVSSGAPFAGARMRTTLG